MTEKENLIVVYTANINDFNNILDLDESVYGARTRGKFIEESIMKNECFKASVGGQIIGFAILNYTFYENGFIALLIVGDSFRRMKVGKKLMEYIESKCITEKLFTSTNQSNLPMLGLLESCGYVRSGHINNLDEGDLELVYFKGIKHGKSVFVSGVFYMT
jgi:ribosomal protein S18 acetylase RimI-like enzyme